MSTKTIIIFILSFAVSIVNIVIFWVALAEFFVSRLGPPIIGPGWVWNIGYIFVNAFIILLETYVLNNYTL